MSDFMYAAIGIAAISLLFRSKEAKRTLWLLAGAFALSASAILIVDLIDLPQCGTTPFEKNACPKEFRASIRYQFALFAYGMGSLFMLLSVYFGGFLVLMAVVFELETRFGKKRR